jgi:hypothetical protein
MSTVRVCLIVMFAASAAPLGLPFVAGPVPARTGGFGEMTCQECHWENPINEPSGRLSLQGTPPTYTPGTRYTIIVDLARPGLVYGGFQLSARFESGPNSGMNAGILRPSDQLAEQLTDEAGRINYVQHTKAGATAAKPGNARWTVEWVAPEASAPVVFHAAANAANGDASPLGDFVYTTSAASAPPGR